MPIVKSNGKTFTFPEGTPQEDIEGALEEHFTQNPPEKQVPSGNGLRRGLAELPLNFAGAPADIVAGVGKIAQAGKDAVSAFTSKNRTWKGERQKRKERGPDLLDKLQGEIGSDRLKQEIAPLLDKVGGPKPKSGLGKFTTAVVGNISPTVVAGAAKAGTKALLKRLTKEVATTAGATAGTQVAGAATDNPLAILLAGLVGGSATTGAAKAAGGVAGAANNLVSKTARDTKALDSVAKEMADLLQGKQKDVAAEISGNLDAIKEKGLSTPDTAMLTNDPLLSALGIKSADGINKIATTVKRKEFLDKLATQWNKLKGDNTEPVNLQKNSQDILDKTLQPATDVLNKTQQELDVVSSPVYTSLAKANADQRKVDTLSPIEQRLKKVTAEIEKTKGSPVEKLQETQALSAEKNRLDAEKMQKVSQADSKLEELKAAGLPETEYRRLKETKEARSAEFVNILQQNRNSARKVKDQLYAKIDDTVPVDKEIYQQVLDSAKATLTPVAQASPQVMSEYNAFIKQAETALEQGASIGDLKTLAKNAKSKLDFTTTGDMKVADKDARDFLTNIGTLVDGVIINHPAVGKDYKNALNYYSKVYAPNFKEGKFGQLLDSATADEAKTLEKVLDNPAKTKQVLSQMEVVQNFEGVQLLQEGFIAKHFDKFADGNTLNYDKLQRFMQERREYIDTIPGLKDKFEELRAEAKQTKDTALAQLTEMQNIKKEKAVLAASYDEKITALTQAADSRKLNVTQQVQDLMEQKKQVEAEYDTAAANLEESFKAQNLASVEYTQNIKNQLDAAKQQYIKLKEAAEFDPLVKVGIDINKTKQLIKKGDASVNPGYIANLRWKLTPEAYKDYQNLYIRAATGDNPLRVTGETLKDQASALKEELAYHDTNIQALYAKEPETLKDFKFFRDRFENIASTQGAFKLDEDQFPQKLGKLVTDISLAAPGGGTMHSFAVGRAVSRMASRLLNVEGRREFIQRMMIDPEFAVMVLNKKVDTRNASRKMEDWLLSRAPQLAALTGRETQQDDNGN